MVRPVLLTLIGLIVCTGLPAKAEPTAEPDPAVAHALAVQRAMLAARDHLARDEAKEAVKALEAEILYINGNPNYLALLRDAYTAYLKQLQLNGAAGSQIDYIRNQLRILDPKGEAAKPTPAAATTAPPSAPATPVASASLTNSEPTVPMRSEVNATPALPPPPDPAPASLPIVAPAAPAKPLEDDPFQQEPAVRSHGADLRAKADAAFQQKQYAEADRLFAQAQQARFDLSREEREAWGYCKLQQVAEKLNRPADGPVTAEVAEQAKQGAELGGERLAAFSRQVLDAVQKRKPAGAGATPVAVPEGWQTLDTANFRVLYRQNKQLAADAGRLAELARTAMFERWSGPVGPTWSPRCDLWLYASAAEYSRETMKPAQSPGHSTVGLKGGRVASRRIDLRYDDAELLDVTLPHEVTYIVISDLFADQPLPRWAEVAMTVLAEPPAEVARYLRAVPRCAQEKKLLAVGKFLNVADFPESAGMTAFYVESVSLVDYLVRLKGAKAFALFLREAPRRGYDKALQTHYGFKDANDLQEKWLKHACGQ
jgi:hypothetical protein